MSDKLLHELRAWGESAALMQHFLGKRSARETCAEAAAEIARLRDALIEARHHVYQASIDRAQPTEASEALTLIDAALTAHKEGKE